MLLQIGRSVLFSGAPGTGKTIRCIEVAEWFTGSKPEVATGRSTITFEKLIDPEAGGPLLRSVIASWLRLAHGLPPRWLLFDELNRANVEVGLGPLFTLLDTRYRTVEDLLPPGLLKRLLEPRILEPIVEDSGVDVTPREAARLLRMLAEKGYAGKLPLSWRLLATMNVFDQSHLYRIGYALLRRMPLLRVAWVRKPEPPSSFNAAACKEARPPRETILDACRVAVEELSMVNIVEVGGDAIIVDMASPRASLTLRLGMARGERARLAERLADGHARLWQCLWRLIRGMAEAGVEPSLSALTDACKLLALEALEAQGSGVDIEAVTLDITIATMLLPLIAAASRILRLEAMLGGTRVERIHELLDTVEEVLGDKSLSHIVAEDVRLELGLGEAS